MGLLAIPFGVFALLSEPLTPVREVWVYENIGYHNAEQPFVRAGPELLFEDQIPPPETIAVIARDAQVVFEICSPRNETGPRSLAERRRDCIMHGESVETRRQP